MHAAEVGSGQPYSWATLQRWGEAGGNRQMLDRNSTVTGARIRSQERRAVQSWEERKTDGFVVKAPDGGSGDLGSGPDCHRLPERLGQVTVLQFPVSKMGIN